MASKTTEWRPGPTVCRCCLTEGCYKDISTEYFWMGKREVYAEMLSETFDLSIAYSQSGGPNSHSRLICEPCISRLRDAADFKRQVQECERTFMQYLDPGSSLAELEVGVDLDKEVKVERVKEEKEQSDDDEFDDRPDFGDDDDYDDLDDQPLTKLASKVPKKESVDVLDLIDNAKVTVKRKSSSKTKVTPAKKAKTKKDIATSSKEKPEPRKKKDVIRPLSLARRNAEVMVKYSTAYPFRLPETSLMCVYCCESYADSSHFRKHMDEEHETFKVETAFAHCAYEGYLKVDCTDLRCRICKKAFKKLDEIAKHLNDVHDQKINLEFHLGIQPFKFENDKLLCGICDKNFPCLRQLSRHMSSHYQNFTCEECGKSYTTNGSLQQHMRFSHITNERICRRCRQTFSSLEAKREHVESSPKCWSYHCFVCALRFMKWSAKEEHLISVHGQAKKTHCCPECGKVFTSRNSYRVHFATTHAGISFVCSWCGRKFSTKRHLEQHTVIHTGLKLFECLVCSKSFPRKANLNQHMWIHSEFKRFECSMCNKQFNQRVSYKSHMKTHHPESEIF
ncbi:zinc finger and BTB domain-containing protein 41-like isoform X14 [Vanessa tameamea]|uniref:Zinc finger and BTB domain-containing protein 41-like isoform X14 n=1 Tax=Vanessa tameamea TaxID=334116 RepID=A0A8B8HX31_VANTA|nr:zinc finger and BTB domain-containing protein 41-like isoform X10 [Vanessa tameamea]